MGTSLGSYQLFPPSTKAETKAEVTHRCSLAALFLIARDGAQPTRTSRVVRIRSLCSCYTRAQSSAIMRRALRLRPATAQTRHSGSRVAGGATTCLRRRLEASWRLASHRTRPPRRHRRSISCTDCFAQSQQIGCVVWQRRDLEPLHRKMETGRRSEVGNGEVRRALALYDSTLRPTEGQFDQHSNTGTLLACSRFNGAQNAHP